MSPGGTTARSIRAQPQDIFNDIARLPCDQQLAAVVVFDRLLDERRLRRAVEGLLAEEPVLGCRFAVSGQRARFEPIEHPTGSIVGEASADGTDLFAAALAETTPLLDPDRGPLLGVTLVREESGDALAVRLDHCAADGQGLKRILGALASHYGDAPETRHSGARRAGRGALPMLRRCGVRKLTAGLGVGREARPGWGLPRIGEPVGPREYLLRDVTPPEFRAMREKGRGYGATVNDLLLTAWLRALFAQLGVAPGEEKALRVSFDMRRWLPGDAPLAAACNLSSTETLVFARNEGEGFLGTLERVAATMRRLKSGAPGVSNATLLELVGRTGYERVKARILPPIALGVAHGSSYPFLSNFGVLRPESLAMGEAAPVRAALLPPASHPPFGMLGAGTFDDALTLAFGFYEGEADRAWLDALLDTVVSELGDWAR